MKLGRLGPLKVLSNKLFHLQNSTFMFSDKRPQFGGRMLTDENYVFQHNAWDNVKWDSSQEALAKEKVENNSEILLGNEKILNYEEHASGYWDSFYLVHQNRFFKDRHWLFIEFPELIQKRENFLTECRSYQDPEKNDRLQDGPHCISNFQILEIGCGVGNTVFPILSANSDQRLHIYCCDFSKTAIDIIKESPEFDKNRLFPFVCDVAAEDWNPPFSPDSLNVIVCIFVLSAINPDRYMHIVRNFYKYLKPGGAVLFRDYGRYDMAQLRFKKGSCLGENFYVRGDGTRCYFFTQDDVKSIMLNAGFQEVYNIVDRRLQVNRGKQLKMYRIWIQAKYTKPV